MSAHPNRPPAGHDHAVELRVLDPGGPDLTFTWQIRDGHSHLLASGQVAGAPNTPELAGWRYHAFTDAAHTAITALQDLEAIRRSTTTASRPRICDFCAVTLAAWRYPAHADQLNTVLIGDALVIIPGGDWHACPACHLLVETGGWDTLSKRAGLPPDQGAALWASFRASRSGPAIPLGRGLGPAGHSHRGPDR
jgi:hypothetical protein